MPAMDDAATNQPETRPRRGCFNNFLALGIGLVVAAGLVALVEYTFLRLNRAEVSRTRIDYEPPQTPTEFRLILGYRPRASHSYTATKVKNGREVYSVRYTFDEYHRRANDTSADASRYLAVFGGSFAMGEGVNDDETVAAQLAAALPDRAVYNFGYSGYGPQHALTQVAHNETWAGIDEPVGDAIYIFIPHHWQRAQVSMRVYTEWGRHFPIYRLQDGELVLGGSFERGRLWRGFVYEYLAREQILRYFEVDWPTQPGRPAVELTDAILTAAESELHDRGGENFAVVLYPERNMDPSSFSNFDDWLEMTTLDIIDYRNAAELGDLFIPGDGHPSPEAFALLAEMLIRDVSWLRKGDNP